MLRKLSLILAVPFIASAAALAGVFYPDGATTLHFAFDGSPNGDRPVIRPPGMYHRDAGFGFVDSPGLIGNARGAQADHYFRFDVNLPDGNYDVTATLGSPLADSTTTIRSQEHRLMVEEAFVARGQIRPVTFTVSVHKDVAAREELNSDGVLHLEFIGQTPAIMKLDIKPNTTAPTVYLVGDSTMCDYNADPRFGWGQMLPDFFKPGEVAVCNVARSGRSAKTFIAEKRLDDVLAGIKAGDFMFIQFAHNDMKEPELTQEAWKSLLMTYINGAREHQATPVLVTSIPRRQFDNAGKIKNSLEEFPETMRKLAQEQKVTLLDLNARATEFFNTLGPVGSTKAFCHYPAGTYAGHPEAGGDDTHFSAYGAFEIARLAALEIAGQKLPLAAHLIDPVSPSNPDPAKFPADLGYNGLLLKQ